MSSVDVIVPCYRYAHFLNECVASVLSQPIERLRVLIIDDASPDHTAEVAADLAKQDPRVELLRHATNRGHIATYNEGIEWASAAYMLLLSADDILLPDALHRAVALLDSHPSVGLVYGRFIYFSDGYPISDLSDPTTLLEASPQQSTAAIVRPESRSKHSNRKESAHDAPKSQESLHNRCRAAPDSYAILNTLEFLKSNRHSNQVHPSNAVVRTALQKMLGGYLTELPHAGDMEMWMRFAVHAPVCFLHNFQSGVRLHGSNMSHVHYYSNMLLDLEQRRLVLDILFGRYGSSIPSFGMVKDVMYRGLAEEAVRLASLESIATDRMQCDDILAFAVEVWPKIRRSLLWTLLAWKRRVAPELWSFTGQAVGPFVRRILRGSLER
jgi:hypothetical protein